MWRERGNRINVRALVFSIILILAPTGQNLGAAGLPTFDFTNFTQAVESLVKAVSFYNSSLAQAKKAITQIEALGKGLTSGDFNMITDSVAGMLEITAKAAEQIDEIIEQCRRKKEEAEIKSKMAALEIIKIVTNPSVNAIKNYAEKRDFANLSASQQMRQIAKDTKDALDIMLNDHSDSAAKAMDNLGLSLEGLGKQIGSLLSSVSKATGDNLGNMTALETLSGLSERLLDVNRSASELSERSRQAKNEIDGSGKEIKEEIARWQNIIDKLDEGMKSSKKLYDSMKSL